MTTMTPTTGTRSDSRASSWLDGLALAAAYLRPGLPVEQLPRPTASRPGSTAEVRLRA